MANDPVKFYFAYNSPYAFLANTRIVEALVRTGVTIEYKPVGKPRPGGAPDVKSPRIRYFREDVGRFARAYAIPLNPGPFANSIMACRGFFFAGEHGEGLTYHNRIFAARWLEEGDIGDQAMLTGIATSIGLDGDAFAAALEDGSPQAAALEQSNADAEADGLFGFPFFVYGDHHFWGNDRIEWLVETIEAGD